MILLTLTLGSRNYFSQRALIPEDHLFVRRFWGYPLIFSRGPCAHCLCNSLPLIYPYGYLHALVILMIISRRSCCYKMPRTILRCPKNPLSLLCCSFILHENPYGFFLTFIEDPFFSIVHVSHIILQNTFRSFKNPLQLVTLETLACLHYG